VRLTAGGPLLSPAAMSGGPGDYEPSTRIRERWSAADTVKLRDAGQTDEPRMQRDIECPAEDAAAAWRICLAGVLPVHQIRSHYGRDPVTIRCPIDALTN